MKTLYIDVYFLINFTVDILSLYFAACFSKVPTSTRRLLISALLGGIIAVIIVLMPEFVILKLIASAIGLLLMALIAPKPVSVKRKVKFVFSFLIFEALVGSAVSFLWGVLDKYISGYFDASQGGSVNRKMLFLSMIVLLSIGVFKMLISFFSNNESEGSVDLEISFREKMTKVSAFVDSGNLAIDPMDMSPVVLLKKDMAKDILPENIINLCDVDSLDRETKKRIRLIPVTRGGHTHVLVGIKADSVKLVRGDNSEELFVTVAIDKEGGSFGGYKALMPSAALDNALL
ncbi:MAG: sigma-E processing peptidase SpoIIGA [Clostridia bacterium]|nr:sigma-E processing peptidase SpoIIGA [Clostridia bacterium]